MTTLKEMAEKYASDSGWCRDMSPYNFDICVKVYLAGAKAALAEMQAWCAIKVNQCVGPEAGRQTEMRQHYAQAYLCAMEKAQTLIPET